VDRGEGSVSFVEQCRDELRVFSVRITENSLKLKLVLKAAKETKLHGDGIPARPIHPRAEPERDGFRASDQLNR